MIQSHLIAEDTFKSRDSVLQRPRIDCQIPSFERSPFDEIKGRVSALVSKF